MARKRDVIVAIVIGGTFLVVMIFGALLLTGIFASGDGIEFSGFGGNIGIIELFGVLTEESGRPIVEQLDRWTDSKGIKAIVLHINSPGGEVPISQELYDAVGRASEQKPVVASMSTVAASGGYYVACAADVVVADPGTLTGSIGVIFQFHTFVSLLEKVGIGTETVKSGELKAVGSYSRDMTKKEELMLRSVVMDTYEQFVEAVAQGRGKDKEDVRRLADGSLYTGLQAYNLELVDTLGGLYEAIEIAAELAGIDGKPKTVRPHSRESLRFRDLLGSLVGELFGGISRQVTDTFEGPRLLYIYK